MSKQRSICNPDKEYYYSAAAVIQYDNFINKVDCKECLLNAQSDSIPAERRRSTRIRKAPERLTYTTFHTKKKAKSATVKKKQSCVAPQNPQNVEDVINDTLPYILNEER